MDADETEAETDVGAVVHELWKILLDCDKSRKDALKSKIREHKKKQKHKEKKQRKKKRRNEKKGRKSSKRGKGRRGSPDSTKAAAAIAIRGLHHLGVPVHQDVPPGGAKMEEDKKEPTSRNSNGSMVSATSKAKN